MTVLLRNIQIQIQLCSRNYVQNSNYVGWLVGWLSLRASEQASGPGGGCGCLGRGQAVAVERSLPVWGKKAHVYLRHKQSHYDTHAQKLTQNKTHISIL
jgi:hypothetical protein